MFISKMMLLQHVHCPFPLPGITPSLFAAFPKCMGPGVTQTCADHRFNSKHT